MSQSPGPGRERQSQIYRDGVVGDRPAAPTHAAGLEEAAESAMSRRAWAYVAGGAGEGRTMRNNREAFDRWAIVPRMLTGAADRDLSRTVLGTRLPAPFALAPVGAGQLVHRDADLVTARAAAATGIPYVFTNQGGTPLEETAAAMGATPHWMQLYWSTDEGLVDSLIGRAEAAGAKALVVTLDTTVLGWRPQDLDLGSLPFARGQGIGQYTSDEHFMGLVDERVAAAAKGEPAERPKVIPSAIRSLLSIARHHPGRLRDNLRTPRPRAAVETFLETYSNPRLSWDHIATLRDRTTLPVVLKGILHPDDARRALDLGVDGIVVSNHGGRQVDSSIASLDALVRVRDAVGPDATVLMDSGIRTGADVFVALALGADAVLLGRPYMYGMAVAGQRGVEEVIANVVAELDLTMALAGVADLASITRDVLVER
ncbi:lactate 2-monooxygenase [Janibacter melonis]|uniref:Lactate 2-monooxygenase n=1 Tax=Janibacter melonis TaxID=262209 RepID=A0A176Q9B5_9MICO|nr:alpha-hydroxy-acid oxidizing protein [Janibacter melonis]OAB86265.1 lactate 2-monooxygenase [Janibacter melonis]